MHNCASHASTIVQEHENRLGFMPSPSKIGHHLAANLTILMQQKDWKPQQLAEKSGVSPRMIAYLLSEERAPTIDIIERLARSFGLEAWQLMLPGIDPTALNANRLSHLISDYSSASDNGRKLIEMIAEREADYPIKKL